MFKVGDKVRFIQECSPFEVGYIAIVEEHKDNLAFGLCVKEGGGICFHANTDYWKLIEENPMMKGGEEKKVKNFEVGARVRSIFNRDPKDLFGTILEHVEGNIWLIKWDDGKVHGDSNNHYSEIFLKFVPFTNNTMALLSKVTLTESQKKNLKPDAQALIEAGFYTNNLNINNSAHFIDFLANKFESEYADFARKELAELEAKEKGEKVKKA